MPFEIEHHFPDYDLYNEFCVGKKHSEIKEYTDCSIGFMTRGCFRKCPFCVNQKYDRVFCHSPLEEFYDPKRKKICLLDDNFFGYPKWKSLLQELINTKKPFKFKQGLDERLLTEDKCEMLFSAKYDGDIYFAFDNIADYDLIKKKLKLLEKYDTKKRCTFYVLVGFDRSGRYDDSFWYQDICDTFKRIELLMQYGCYPYIMRFNKYEESPYRGIYITLARWCNQKSIFKKKSLFEYADPSKTKCQGKAPMRYIEDLLRKNPEFDTHYLTMKYLYRGEDGEN